MNIKILPFTDKKMKIEIWSDIRCPFCYIGKRKFEEALNRFSEKDKVEIIWRSFELDPDLKTNPEISATDYLAQTKGMHPDQVAQMIEHVKQSARETGLDFDFENNILANSYHAHRLIQFAQSAGLGSEAEEALFEAHLTKGKNIDDKEVLLRAGTSIGLNADQVNQLLSSDDFGDKVRDDQNKAQSLGIRGVPFFVFDEKYAVSGAQSPDVFLNALQQTWTEWIGSQNNSAEGDGMSCTIDGECD